MAQRRPTGSPPRAAPGKRASHRRGLLIRLGRAANDNRAGAVQWLRLAAVLLLAAAIGAYLLGVIR